MDQNQKSVNCLTASIEEIKKAYYDRTPISGITTVGTHYGPHNDELCAGYLLSHTPQGRHLFPEIEHASFGCISTTTLRKEDMLGKQGFFKALQKGLLLLGLGNGPLDEHGSRTKASSCTELVVTLLDLQRDKNDRKMYGKLIDYVNFEDSNGDNVMQCLNRLRGDGDRKLYREEVEMLQKLQIGAFAQNLKKGFEAAGSDPELQKKEFEMAFKFYDNEIAQSKLFLDAEHAYETAPKHEIDLVTPQKNIPFVILEIKSGIPVMNKVVQSKWRDNRTKKLGVLFLHKPNGQFVLMPNQQYIKAEEMRPVVKILRQMVMRAAGKQPIQFKELGKGEMLDLVPEIYFDEATGVISNGSKVDPDVEGLIGTFLSVEDVTDAILIAFDTDYFEPRFEKQCRKNDCVKGRCPLYNYGLPRCHEARSKGAQGPLAEQLKKIVMHEHSVH